MTRTRLLSLAGLAAIIGGFLRVLSSVAPAFLDGRDAQDLFLVTDIFLTLGLIGFYAAIATRAGGVGLIGFVMAIASMLVLQGDDSYQLGAILFGAGIVVMGLAALVTRSFAWLAPLLWTLGIAVGIFGVVMPLYSQTFVVSGLLFAAGFIAAGLQLRRQN